MDLSEKPSVESIEIAEGVVGESMKVLKQAVFTLFLFFFLVNFCWAGKGIKVKVLRVIDGDTVVITPLENVQGLRAKERLRYAGINTLETFTPTRIPQPFAVEAKELNKKLTEGKVLYLKLSLRLRDRYGRLLGDLITPSGKSVSAELVRKGLALVCLYPGNAEFYQALLPLEREAIRSRKGIFSLLKREPKNFPLFGNKKSKRFFHPWSRDLWHIKRKIKFNSFEEAFLKGYCPAPDTLALFLFLYYF